MTASLYTHIAQYCAPCPRHSRPRLHRSPRPPQPLSAPVPFEMPEPVKQAEPMSQARRVLAYICQNGRPTLTGRQARQVKRMQARSKA